MLDDEISRFLIGDEIEVLALVKRCARELLKTEIREAGRRQRNHVAIFPNEVNDGIGALVLRGIEEERVGAGVAPKDVVPGPARHGIVTFSGQNRVIAVAGLDLIVAGQRQNKIVAAKRVNDIVIVGTKDPFAGVGTLDNVFGAANDRWNSA